MEFRFTTTCYSYFYEDKLTHYLNKLKDFSPSKKEVRDEEYAIYIKIETIEQLVNLFYTLGHHIVFGDVEDKDKGAHVTIEDYDDYRE